MYIDGGRLTELFVDEIRYIYIYISTILIITRYISEHMQKKQVERERKARSLRITHLFPVSD